MTASRLARRLVVVAGAVTVGFGAQLASTAAPAYQSAPLAAPGRPASGMIPATDPDDAEGFTAIFDGKTLAGWEGDLTFWRAENGVIVGETTAEKPAKANTFLIWRGGVVRDFELKVDFRLNGANSGIQYRSVEVPSAGKFVLKGYQADMDFAPGYLGNIHDELGRGPGAGHIILSPRGQITRIVDGPKYKEIGKIADPTLLRGVMNVGGWNRYHIIARGPVLMQLINGQLMSIAIDEDTAHAPKEGVIGFQLHTGPPLKIGYRTVMYRKI